MGGMGYTIVVKQKPLYNIWRGMKDRCYNRSNPHYKDYGGRGIRVCMRWLESYQNFEQDMLPRPSPQHELDRINNNSDYHPNNTQWVLHAENCAYSKRRVRNDNKVRCSGVYYDKKRKRYHATITIHTRRIHLGRYISKELAIKVRKSAEQRFMGMID